MNRITLCGRMNEKPTYSHTVGKIRFYSFHMIVRRLSGYEDIIPCIAEQGIANQIQNGTVHKITGAIHSRQVFDGKRTHLELFVHVESISMVFEADRNHTEITGVIVKKPVFRQTQSGRYIAELLVVSSRKNRKTDCIPCIVWSVNALFAKNLATGKTVTIKGRFQSRQYEKDGRTKTVYELSGNELKLGVRTWKI